MSAKSTGAGEKNDGFSEEERAAIKARAAELKKEAGTGRGNKAAKNELEVLEKISEMEPADRALAERIHAIVTEVAPGLSPKLWYGQPAYADKSKVVCFFRSGNDDKERYSTFGFTPEAKLDDAIGLWATSFAVADLGEPAEKQLAELIRVAAG